MKRLVAALSLGAVLAAAGGAPLEDLRALPPGGERPVAAALEDQLRSTNAAARAALEQGLVAVALDAKATATGRALALRLLRLQATESAALAILPLVEDPDLGHLARFALEGVASPRIDAALRVRLDAAAGPPLVGLIGTIGRRRDPKAVKPLRRLAEGTNGAAHAAVVALGHVGTAEAATALEKLRPAPALLTPWASALLEAADGLHDGGETAAARSAYRAVHARATDGAARMAAAGGRLLGGDDVLPDLERALAEGTPVERQGAVRVLRNTPRADIIGWTYRICSRLPPEAQGELLAFYADLREETARPIASMLMTSTSSVVRLAAFDALAGVGGPQEAMLLLKVAVGGGAEGEAALAALGTMTREGVDDALATAVIAANPAVRATALRSLGERRAAAKMPVVMQVLGDADEHVRAAALKAMRGVAGPAEAPALLRQLLATSDEQTVDGLQQVLAGIMKVGPVTAEMQESVFALFRASGADGQLTLLPVVAVLDSKQALQAIQPLLKSANVEVVRASLRILCQWQNAAPVPDLLAAAEHDPNEARRILALRGALDLLARDAAVKPAQRISALRKAYSLATRPDEKIAILGQLGALAEADAVVLAAGGLDDPKLREAAAAAVVASAAALKPPQPDTVRSALTHVSELMPDTDAGRQANKLAKKLSPPAAR